MPPGQSPFHVRGSTYLGIREYIDRHIPNGLPAVLAHLPDTAHREFASQTFLPVAMYDALLIRPYTEATAAVEGKPYAASVTSRAKTIAQRDVAGLYRLLLRAVSPATAAERLQRAALRYFDFGSFAIVETSKQHCTILQSGWPAFLMPWFTAMIEGYAKVVLEAAGGRLVAVSSESPRTEGKQGGIDTVSTRITMSWA